MGQRHSHASQPPAQTPGQAKAALAPPSPLDQGASEDLIDLDFDLQRSGRRGQHRRSRRRQPSLLTRSNASAASRRPLAVGLVLGLCKGLALVPWRTVATSLRLASTTACFGAAAGLCAFFPRASKVVGLLSFLGRQRVLGVAPSPPAVRLVLRPLRPLSGPFLTFFCMWAIMPLAVPGMWRALMYWQRSTPLVTSYFVTRCRARRAQRLAQAGSPTAATAEQLWQAQHQQGAERIFQMLCELKGFYLKLGQILAAKTDMLPAPYTASLTRLLDKMPATPFPQVQKTLETELGGNLSSFFSCVDPFPLASATVAQVHQARLTNGTDVVLKLQHRGTKRMMKADLHNLRLCCRALDALHVNLGFDLTSVVLEYCEQVPLEFDFEREAEMARTIRAALLDHAEHFPLLQQVVVPQMISYLSTPRLLTMEHMDGVPLLDIAGMDLDIKTQLMSALLLAYGIMILRTGVFHSDPHPGNLLACCNNAAGLLEPSVRVAILDFGQVKQLSDESRLRYALLVCALASREDQLLVATMRELGLLVENCSQDFEAIAGHILFDTRMDFPEAHQSPLDPDANVGWRSAKVPSLPQDLFMVVRVITLLRGIMHSLGLDISSSLMWRPLALQTIAELSSPQDKAGLAWRLNPDAQTQGLEAGVDRGLAEAVQQKLLEQEVARRQAREERADVAARVAGSGVPGTPRSGAVGPRCSWGGRLQQHPFQQQQQTIGGSVSPVRAWRGSGSPQASAAADLAEFLANQQQVHLEQPQGEQQGRIQRVELL